MSSLVALPFSHEKQMLPLPRPPELLEDEWIMSGQQQCPQNPPKRSLTPTVRSLQPAVFIICVLFIFLFTLRRHIYDHFLRSLEEVVSANGEENAGHPQAENWSLQVSWWHLSQPRLLGCCVS
jgi:hypothetical protein